MPGRSCGLRPRRLRLTSAGATFEDSTNELSVAVGKAVLVDCAQPIQRVAVGLGDIAEATAVSPTEIMVNGKAPGETSLIIWDIHGGRQFFNVTVRANAPPISSDNLDAIRRELRTELPGQAIRVSYNNNNIFLRGTVSDLTSSARAVEIASTAGKVVNLLDVNVPTSDPQILLKVRFRQRGSQQGASAGHQPVQPRAGKCNWRSDDRPDLRRRPFRRQPASAAQRVGISNRDGGTATLYPGAESSCLLPRPERRAPTFTLWRPRAWCRCWRSRI